MAKWFLELIIMIVAMVLIFVSISLLGFENTTVFVLALIVGKVMGGDIWREKKE